MFNEATWKTGELETQKYMKKCGYKILYTNYSCANVELDIVAICPVKVQKKLLKLDLKRKLKDKKNCKIDPKILKNSYKMAINDLKDILVITEVKARASSDYGEGVYAITSSKENHIRRGANYLLKQNQFSNMQVRFDVSSVDGGKINYIENAF